MNNFLITRYLTSYRQKCTLLIAIVIAVIIALFILDPIPQDPNYHNFVDTRTLLGIPNAADVLSNVGFLIVGCLALVSGLKGNFKGALPQLNKVYLTLFLGILLTAFGSSYYHLSPNNNTLVWDRLPMTIAFMALFTMVVGEHIADEFAATIFGPLIALGVFSVAYWHFTEQKGLSDLRFYALIQFLPIVLIPIIILLFKSPFTSTAPIWLAIGFYVLAKLTELFDQEIYSLNLGFSGHSIKHLLAAMGASAIWWGLVTRQKRNADQIG